MMSKQANTENGKRKPVPAGPVVDATKSSTHLRPMIDPYRKAAKRSR